MQEFNYTLSDLENMTPLEREIYLGMLSEHLKEKMQEAQRRKQAG